MSPVEVPKEREQGAVKAEEELKAGAVQPVEGTVTEQEEAAIENAVAQTAPVVQEGQQAPVGQQGFTVRNPNMLLPATANLSGVAGTRRKTPVEIDYDIGRFWEILASDSRASNLTRMIARGLMGSPK